MKIGIIGPGALGCLFASRLFLAATRHRQDSVLLIDYNPQRSSLLNDQGIYYEKDGTIQKLAIPVVANSDAVAYCDVLFCCIKSYHLEQALRRFGHLLSVDTLFIFFQNGISHIHYTEGSFPCIPVLGSSSEAANTVSPGHIRHAGGGHSYLGFTTYQEDLATKRLHNVRRLLCKGAIDTTISDDILSQLWAKLFVNVGINALTAIYNCPNGELLSSPDITKTMACLLQEATAVANASGVTIHASPLTETHSVCIKTRLNISSMLQDVHMQRPTEIKAINGAICRLGKKHGIPTPCNDNIVKRILSLEKKYNEHCTQ